MYEANIYYQVGVKDYRPNRPENTDKISISDELWAVIEKCWVRDPVSRPPMRDVAIDLTRICATERPLRLLSIGS